MNKVIFENEVIKITKLSYPKHKDIRSVLKDSLKEDKTFTELKMRMAVYNHEICPYIVECYEKLIKQFPKTNFIETKKQILTYCIEEFNKKA